MAVEEISSETAQVAGRRGLVTIALRKLFPRAVARTFRLLSKEGTSKSQPDFINTVVGVSSLDKHRSKSDLIGTKYAPAEYLQRKTQADLKGVVRWYLDPGEKHRKKLDKHININNIIKANAEGFQMLPTIVRMRAKRSPPPNASYGMNETELKEEDEKTKLLKEFRKHMSDLLKPHHSDEYLLRWLRLRNYDLKKAERHLRSCLHSRATYEIDEIPQKLVEPEVVKKYGFLGFLGFDRDGTPIRYIGIGRGDYDGFVRSMSTFDICVFCAYIIERDMDAMRKNDAKVGKFREDELLAIFDMEGFTLQQIAYKHVIETGIDLMRMFQEYNPPELLKRLVVINAPVYFSVVYNTFKPIAKLDFLQKLEVHSRESSPAALLKYISPDVLPKFLGGDRVDENGDLQCSAFIKCGGKIPESYYGCNKPKLSPSDPGVTDVTVAARTIYDYPVEVPEAGMRLHIEFWSDDAIYLHIVYKQKVDSICTKNGYRRNGERPPEFYEQIVSPVAKIQSHITPVDNEVFCERAGTYIFRFDNTCSWMYSKRIVHRIQPYMPKT